MTDPADDVKKINYSASHQVQSCETATSAYSHVDIMNVTLNHTSGIGYNITVCLAGDFILNSHTDLKIYIDVTGSVSPRPKNMAEAESNHDYTFYVNLYKGTSSWLDWVWFNDTNVLVCVSSFTGTNEVMFPIPAANEPWVNGTSGFQADISDWVVYGACSDDNYTLTYDLIDTFQWTELDTYLNGLCTGGGISGYNFVFIFFASLGAFWWVWKRASLKRKEL